MSHQSCVASSQAHSTTSLTPSHSTVSAGSLHCTLRPDDEGHSSCFGAAGACWAVPLPSSTSAVYEYPCVHVGHAGGSKEFLVRASYLEIYNEEIRDLLSKNPQSRLELKEHPERGVYVKDLMQFVVKSVAEINSVLQVGGVSWGRG